MGRVEKGISCSVTGCGGAGERSISRSQLAGSGISAGGEGRRVYLCHEHYKSWKKSTKKDRDAERARWG